MRPVLAQPRLRKLALGPGELLLEAAPLNGLNLALELRLNRGQALQNAEDDRRAAAWRRRGAGAGTAAAAEARVGRVAALRGCAEARVRGHVVVAVDAAGLAPLGALLEGGAHGRAATRAAAEAARGLLALLVRDNNVVECVQRGDARQHARAVVNLLRAGVVDEPQLAQQLEELERLEHLAEVRDGVVAEVELLEVLEGKQRAAQRHDAVARREKAPQAHVRVEALDGRQLVVLQPEALEVREEREALENLEAAVAERELRRRAHRGGRDGRQAVERPRDDLADVLGRQRARVAALGQSLQSGHWARSWFTPKLYFSKAARGRWVTY